MTFAEILMLATVGIVAFPLWSWYNPTAWGLGLSYLVCRGAWWLFGLSLSSGLCLLLDLTVIALIYAKQPAYDLYPYKTRGDQAKAFWLELSLWDRIVLGLFPFVWVGYFAPLSEYHAWWWGYWTSMAQLAAAGIESLTLFFSTRAAMRVPPVDPPSGLLFNYPGRRLVGDG